ncbi:LysR family transcriptional regulator [Serratia marcescens]|uniref:LysR family transcriptional regulator n=1 Tax=Serratia marcescens TaxID=615 RepID=UPI0040598412
MDIKQLIYLCNLERERHFGRAAEASFVSQPTLSMRLKNLEKELGVSLINRGNHFGGFTAEGERVLAWAREIVSVYQGLKLEVESLKHGLHGTLRLGVVPQCSISVAEMLKAVSERYPHLDYRLAVLSADQLLEALTAHTVDIGIGFFELSTLKELHFQSQPLVETGVELVFHPQHFPKLVGDTPLPLEAVAALPLCLAEPTRYFRRYLDQHFRDAGLTLHPRLETASIFQLLEGIFVGLGCGLFPRGQLQSPLMPELQRRPVAIAAMPRHAAVVVDMAERATPLAQKFFDAASEWLRREKE